MIRHKLAIKQHISRPPHQRDQPCERNFAGIVSPRKHAFAAKCAVEGDTVQAAYQSAILPAFH